MFSYVVCGIRISSCMCIFFIIFNYVLGHSISE